MILGTNIISPTMAAPMASMSTAPAARSLVRLIASLYPGETKSAIASIDEFTASAASTVPMANVTAIHSVVEMPKANPAIMTQNAAEQCIHALCSLVMRSFIPLKANLKLLSLFLNVNPSFFIFTL